METKKDLRIRIKQHRSAMTDIQVKETSNEIVRKIEETELFQKARIIYAYYPLGNEVSLLPLMEKCLRLGKTLALPKVSGDNMEFYQIQSIDEVAEGCFHVMEPVTEQKTSAENALVLVPGVAFDRLGNRIGYGKGYYDRYFHSHPGLIRLGIAYELQVVEQIPVEATDQKLDYLMTDQKFLTF